MTKGIYMTQREVNRAEIFVQISQKKISQTKAAKELGLSIRQIQRLYYSYKVNGLSALVSKKRGKPSNHQLSCFQKARVKELVMSELYNGFGPTLMCEKLKELHKISISRETTRQLMIECGVWRQKRQKRPVVYQQRQRRPRYGELLQIDSSPHAWLEERGETCALLVFIDDATGRTYGKFWPVECTHAYMVTMSEYIKKFGKPLAAYSDRHGIFRVNKPGCIRKENLTQFGRAMKELNIELICANSPQAKGRVERANQTLQDRLVKEMRLAGINTMEEANQFLEGYWDVFNKQFAVEPTVQEDSHRKIFIDQEIEKSLCEKHYRKVTKNLEIQFENKIYQIVLKSPTRQLIGAQIEVLKQLDDTILLEYKGKSLPFQEYSQQISNGNVVSSKELNMHIDEKARMKKPSKNHPWSQQGRAEQRRKQYSCV